MPEFSTEQQNLDEPEEKTPSADELKKILADLNSRKEKYEGYLDYLTESGETQILETDLEPHYKP